VISATSGCSGASTRIGGAEQRVGARREHLDLLRRALDVERDPRAHRAADPVALHLLDRLGPVDEVEVLDEAVGVGGDPQHPLPHRPPLDRVAAALALAVDHLLVREHGAERRAPVHRHLGEIGEPALVEAAEDPLRPLDVLRIGGVDLARPVVVEAERLELALERRDVLRGGLARVGAGLDRILLGRAVRTRPSPSDAAR
jgi:hypothetical protein